MSDPRNELADILIARQEDIRNSRVVAGLDGFIDEMISIVDERRGLDDFTAVSDMAAFAGMLQAAAGRSSLREIVINSTDAGGCAVNLGDGIASLGAQLDYFGTLGKPRHKAFDAFAAKCRSCTSWGTDPGLTLALEFNNGKYMLSSVSQLSALDTDLLGQELADGSFRTACEAAGLIALTNWTLYPHMTDCWAHLQEQVFATLSHKPWFFIDLVDPRSRKEQDIRDMLKVLQGFEAHGRTIFGGNLNEANVIAGLLGLEQVEKEEAEAVQQQAQAIRSTLGLSQVVTHCLAGAACAEADGTSWAAGPYTPTPKKSTGAGDRFNGAYCVGQLLGLPAEQRLLLGNAASGCFVRQAFSGDIPAVAKLLQAWAAGELAD